MLTREKLNSNFLSIQVLIAYLLLGKWNAVLILSMYFIHICQRKVSIKSFCALAILSHGSWVNSYFRKTEFCENQLWKSKEILEEGLYTSHDYLTEKSCCYLCARIVPGSDSRRELSVEVSGIFSILSAPVSMKLLWGRSRQITYAPCIHHCTHKDPQNFLAFNFNLKFFSIYFLWVLEINLQPWVSKPCCTKALLGWLLVDLFQEDRGCHRY